MILFKDIHIPKPCFVDYDSLPGNEVKRFCGSCEKHVYDFRGKDESYFNSIIHTQGKVCGIFYEDDIQPATVKIERPFYYVVAAKLIGVFLFLKTLFSSDHAQASAIQTYPTTQQSSDSTAIKIVLKNSSTTYTSYTLDIFINNIFYKTITNLNGNDHIILPDSLKENDAIKVIVRGSKNKSRTHIYKIKKREYDFIYGDSNKIIIQITNTKKAILIKRRRPQAAGYMYY